MGKLLASFILGLLLVTLYLPAFERAAAKGMGVEPRVGSPGSQVTLLALFPGQAPDGRIDIVLVPQGPSPGDCSAVLATVTGRTAEAVSPESWELSTAAAIPDTLTCAGGARVPVEAGMYWIEARGVEIEGRPNFPQELVRAQFGVPAFTGGTLGCCFDSHVLLDDATVKALGRNFPGQPLTTDISRVHEVEIGHAVGDALILTLVCPAGCHEDPISGHKAGILQVYYFPYLDAEGGLISFNPGPPFYRLEPELAQALNRPVGLTPERRLEELKQTEDTFPPTGRDWAPYIVASVAGGLALAAGAFAFGVLTGRRRA